MTFNLREAGTEVCEGTEEWRSRIEQPESTKYSMRFHVPTALASESLEPEDSVGTRDCRDEFEVIGNRFSLP